MITRLRIRVFDENQFFWAVNLQKNGSSPKKCNTQGEACSMIGLEDIECAKWAFFGGSLKELKKKKKKKKKKKQGPKIVCLFGIVKIISYWYKLVVIFWKAFLVEFLEN